MATPKLIIQKANAFQLKPGNSYIVHAPGITPEDTATLREWLDNQGITDALVVATELFSITEKQNV